MKISEVLKIRLPNWRKEKIRRAAENAGETMSEYALIAIDERIERDRKKLCPQTHNTA